MVPATESFSKKENPCCVLVGCQFWNFCPQCRQYEIRAWVAGPDPRCRETRRFVLKVWIFVNSEGNGDRVDRNRYFRLADRKIGKVSRKFVANQSAQVCALNAFLDTTHGLGHANSEPRQNQSRVALQRSQRLNESCPVRFLTFKRLDEGVLNRKPMSKAILTQCVDGFSCAILPIRPAYYSKPGFIEDIVELQPALNNLFVAHGLSTIWSLFEPNLKGAYFSRAPSGTSSRNPASTGAPPSSEAASNMPFDSRPLILRGARLATITILRPMSFSGS